MENIERKERETELMQEVLNCTHRYADRTRSFCLVCGEDISLALQGNPSNPSSTPIETPSLSLKG
jgi:hypothetical protein